MIELCTSSLGTRAQLEDVRAWFEGYETEAEAFWLGQSLERVEARVGWVERGREDVSAWLREKGYCREDDAEVVREELC